MLRKILVLLIVLLSVTGVRAQDASGWRLVNVEDLLPKLETYGKVNSTLALSPDGTRLLWTYEHSLCLYELDTEEGKCQPLPEKFAPGFNEYNAPKWSYDSAYITFNEDTFRAMRESDVWVYKLASGVFTNLTDDGVESSWFRDEVKPSLDYALAWSPVNDDLYFFRSQKAADGWTLDLYRTYPGNYKPEQIASFTNTFQRFSVYFPPAISPDGKTMAVLVLDQTLKDPTDGLWTINLADGQAKQIVALPGLVKAGFPDWQNVEAMFPREVAWVDNDTMLVQVYNTQYMTGVSWGVQVVDVTSGDVTPLVDMSSVADAPTLFNMGDSGHSLVDTMVRSAFVLPQPDAIIYNHFDISGQDQTGLSLMALPPDGKPVAVGDAPGCAVTKVPGMPKMLQNIAPNGRAVLYNCLLTFEQ